MSFGKNMRLAMQERGMNGIELSRKSGIEPDCISRYINDLMMPYYYDAIDIADTLDVSLDWLMDRESRNNQPAENTPLWDILNELRTLCGISWKDLQVEAKVDRRTLNRIRDGENIKLTTLDKLANYFETSADFLSGRGVRGDII